MSKVRKQLNPHVRMYASYNFVDKDPVIYQIEAIIEQTGISFAEIERRSGVVNTTLKNWFSGKTKRPMHATIMAVLRAIGYTYAIVPFDPKKDTSLTRPAYGKLPSLPSQLPQSITGKPRKPTKHPRAVKTSGG